MAGAMGAAGGIPYMANESGTKAYVQSFGLALHEELKKSDVNVIATLGAHRVNVLVWNFQDEFTDSPPAEIYVRVEGLPKGVPQMLLEHWRVDHDHSNSYTAWQKMGSPPNPSADQYQSLKAAGQLQLLESPRWVAVDRCAMEFSFTEPTEGVSLLDLTW